MRVLLALPEPPLREGRAAGRCALAMVDGLRRRSVDVRVLAARQQFALAGAPPADLPVEVVEVHPEPPGWTTRLRRLRRPLGELGQGEFAARVRAAAAGVDVVHLEETATAWAGEGVAAPALVHLHFLVHRDRPLGPPWRQDARYAVEQHLGERAAMRRHRWLVASSPLVAAELRARARHAHVELVPLCLRPEDHPPAPLDGPPVAGIIGTAQWPTTAAAMRTLVGRVWPEVRRRHPGARLVVAGRGTDTLLAGPLPPGAEAVGEVASTSAFLGGLSVLVHPLQRGSGMKVKVLEAIACGVPVVTTPAGAEGIDGGDGVIVAREPEAIAAATARLLGDPDERRQRGTAAREAFLARYTPERTTEPLVALYRRMAEAGA